jgi:hypothetical protein
MPSVWRLWWEDHRNEWILTPLPLQVFQSHRRQMLLWAPGTTLFFLATSEIIQTIQIQVSFPKFKHLHGLPRPKIVKLKLIVVLQIGLPPLPLLQVSRHHHQRRDDQLQIGSRQFQMKKCTPLLFWEEEDDPSYHTMNQKKIFVRAVACHNKEEDGQEKSTYNWKLSHQDKNLPQTKFLPPLEKEKKSQVTLSH